ncbi:MAG: RNA polymerase factor sigma-32 [Polyangiaceae bacterium]|nr:RNA polymerase factor sigma-32 [Polyangiaceae bacterium]
MANDKGGGRLKRSTPDTDDDELAIDKDAIDSRGESELKSTPKRGKNATAARQAKPAEAQSEATKKEDEDEDEDEGRDDLDDPEAVDGEVIDVAAEIIDEESVDGDSPKVVERSLRSDRPEREESAALSRTDPLQAYLREVQRHKLLTPDEEKELTTKFATTQDARTAARLVTANLRLVVKLAYEYRRAYKNIMDLIQEGNIGLMQAVKRYDPYRGVKLSSYAAWWIRAYILRFILNNWRLVKLGTTQAQRKLFFNLNKEKAKLSALGIEPEAAEIAKRLGVEEKEVIDMDRRLSSGEASLDAPVGDSDGRSVSRLDMMASHLSGPDAAFEHEEMGKLVKERLDEFKKTLKGKDIIIFEKRMVADEPLTLQELGDEFGVSRERVRQLEARLAHKLRIYLKQELGDAVDNV